jgi:hypothetical protein
MRHARKRLLRRREVMGGLANAQTLHVLGDGASKPCSKHPCQVHGMHLNILGEIDDAHTIRKHIVDAVAHAIDPNREPRASRVF